MSVGPPSRDLPPRSAQGQGAAAGAESAGGRGPDGGSARKWPGLLGVATLVALPVVSLVAFAAPWLQGSNASGDDVVGVAAEMSHVHGLGTNPEDGATYVATHSGVFKLAEGADPVRVADRYQDTMGFTVAGPNRFLASGHPDLADASLPTHLGLIESTDAAQTWQELSLGGEADLHALDVGPGGVVAFDALWGRLMSSEDGRAWTTIAEGAVIDVATDPTDVGAVVATSPDGELVSYDAQQRRATLSAAPPVGFVDWPAEDLLIAAGADGQLFRSDDGGESFETVGDPLGTPQAIDVSEDAWLVATETGVLRSVDEGETWERLVQFAS